MAEVNDVVMDEVAEWLKLDDRDYNWESHSKQLHRIPPTFLESPLERPAAATDNLDTIDSELHFIALQLLASCYTRLPASSADNLPFYQQRRRPQLVTSLRAHSRYRYSPATGYQAREPSESSGWPGLYSGPSLEDRLADLICEQRRHAKLGGYRYQSTEDTMSEETRERFYDSRAYVTASDHSLDSEASSPFSSSHNANEWSDGPAPYGESEKRGEPGAISGWGSPSSKGFLGKLRCQPSPPSSTKRRAHLLGHLPNISKVFPGQHQHRKTTLSSRRSPVRPSTSLIPLRLRLRRTSSAPRQHEDPQRGVVILDSRRNSSTPSIGRPREAAEAREIPEIRRISASTQGHASAQFGGTGDLHTAQEYIDESRLHPSRLFEPSRHTSFSSDAISPMCTTETTKPGRYTSGNDYFDRNRVRPHEEVCGEVTFWPRLGHDEGDCEDSMASIDDEDTLSDDSVDILCKRQGTFLRQSDISPDVVQKLRIQPEGETCTRQDSEASVET